MRPLIFNLPGKIEFSAGKLLFILFGLLLCGPVVELGSETYKMITYYPAPYGSYRKFVSTGDTWLARDSGMVLIGLKKASGPGFVLETGGAIKSGGAVIVSTAPDSYTPLGGLRVFGDKLQYSNGAAWKEVGGNGNTDGLVKQYRVLVTGSASSYPTSFTSNASVTSCTIKQYPSATCTWSAQCYGCGSRSCGMSSGGGTIAASPTGCSASAAGNTISVSYSYSCPDPGWCRPTGNTTAQIQGYTSSVTSRNESSAKAEVTINDFSYLTP